MPSIRNEKNHRAMCVLGLGVMRLCLCQVYWALCVLSLRVVRLCLCHVYRMRKSQGSAYIDPTNSEALVSPSIQNEKITGFCVYCVHEQLGSALPNI